MYKIPKEQVTYYVFGLGNWRSREDRCRPEKPKQVWNQRNCKNWKGRVFVFLFISCSHVGFCPNTSLVLISIPIGFNRLH